MKFLVLGCNGMAGHMISLYLKEHAHKVEGFAREESKLIKTVVGDVRDLELLSETIVRENYHAVINCIGLLNQFAENDHEAAVYLNSYLPQFLAKLTEESDTKALGELVNKKDITFRNSIIGPDMKKDGIGLINWFMQQKGRVKGYTNAIWTGQTSLQLAKTIENAVSQKIYGLYHMVPEGNISKYNMLVLFNKYLRNKPIEIVEENNLKIDKSLKRTNYKMFPYRIPGYEEQIKELGEWMQKHKELYPHYEM